MKIFKSKAILLRKIKYSESSLIIDLFTEENGLRSYIVNGVRSSKKRSKSAYFSIFCILDIVAYQGSTDKLSRLKEYKYHHSFDNINTDVIKSSVGFFIIEVMQNVITDRSPQVELYNLLHRWLEYINENDAHSLSNAPILYLLNIASSIGIEPRDNYNDDNFLDLNDGEFKDQPDRTDGHIYLSLESSYYLHKLMTLSNAEKWTMKIPKQERNKIVDGLLSYFRIHHPQFRELKSVSVLRSIF